MMNLTNEQIERATGGRWLSLGLSVVAIVILIVSVSIIGHRQKKVDSQLEARVFRLAMELMEKHDTAMMVRLDALGNVAYLNSNARQDLPLEIGGRIDAIIPDEMQQRHELAMSTALKSSEPKVSNIECEIVTRNGTRRVRIEAGAAREGAFAMIEYVD